MLPLILGGAALLGAGIVAGIRKSHRNPLPVDVAAIIRVALRSNNPAQLDSALGAIAGKYPHQVTILHAADMLSQDAHVPADIEGLYRTAFHSGQPETLQATAKALDVKYHYLASKLKDVAHILQNLTGVA